MLRMFAGSRTVNFLLDKTVLTTNLHGQQHGISARISIVACEGFFKHKDSGYKLQR
jgi:hypothetical protein